MHGHKPRNILFRISHGLAELNLHLGRQPQGLCQSVAVHHGADHCGKTFRCTEKIHVLTDVTGMVGRIEDFVAVAGEFGGVGNIGDGRGGRAEHSGLLPEFASQILFADKFQRMRGRFIQIRSVWKRHIEIHVLEISGGGCGMTSVRTVDSVSRIEQIGKGLHVHFFIFIVGSGAFPLGQDLHQRFPSVFIRRRQTARAFRSDCRDCEKNAETKQTDLFHVHPDSLS